MAHYTAAVISKDLTEVDKLLEPYCVYGCELVLRRDDIIKMGRRELEEFNKYFYSKFIIDKDKFRDKYKYNRYFLDYVENEFPEDYKISDEDLYFHVLRKLRIREEDYNNREIIIEINPDGKYSRYSCGYNEMTFYNFKNSDGSIRRDYRGLVKDLILDSHLDADDRKSFEDNWNRIVEVKMRDNYDSPELREYYERKYNEKRYVLDTYGNFENYLKYMELVSTDAVVTPDGVWHDNFLRDSTGNIKDCICDEKEWIDSYYDRFIKMHEDYYITFISFDPY